MESAKHAPSENALQLAWQDRDLSWLEFNRRVLHEAQDERTPLLERLKFLAIFTSNLDEFFMKRVGTLRHQAAAGLTVRTGPGLPPAQLLAEIRRMVLEMVTAQSIAFARDIVPALAERKVFLHAWADMTDGQRQAANAWFRANVFPALTPLSVDPGHPFPFVSNLSTSLGVVLRYPDSDTWHFARLKVPNVFPQWIAIPRTEDVEGLYYYSLHDMLLHNLEGLFPGMVVVDTMLFRVSRSATVEVEDDEGDDLREIVAEELRLRRFARVVRLEHGPRPNEWMLDLLQRQFQLNDTDVYEVPGELDYTGLFPIAGLNLPELRDKPWTPVAPPLLADEDADIFAVIRSGDFLVHHPYESFSASVEKFIRAATEDPQVVAVKMTVYRVGDDTPFIRTLIEAAEAGKQVACLVELQARFDEHRNLRWAQALEAVGAHVVYGVLGLKTHTKVALVVRQEADGLRCYAHIGTGNYHVKTARLYTDLGLFTCDPDLTADIVDLFHYLTGRSLKRDYRALLVAPAAMRDRFLEMIDREIAHQAAGRPAGITAKMNQLEDPAICKALCRASQAGVDVLVFVRGFCCLRPGVPGVTDRVKIVCVIGRFLEHSRIFSFRNGQEDPLEGEFYIGSADWMSRNLSNRVEAITPVKPRRLREKLWEIMRIMQADHRLAWDMNADGTYTQRTPPPGVTTGPEALGTHETLMELTRAANALLIQAANGK